MMSDDRWIDLPDECDKAHSNTHSGTSLRDNGEDVTPSSSDNIPGLNDLYIQEDGKSHVSDDNAGKKKKTSRIIGWGLRRFSTIAESLGFPFLSAYLDSLGANFSHGVNFATASSTIIDQNVTLSQGGYSPFSLGVQLREFMQFKSRSQFVYNRGGVFKDLMPKEDYFSRALYTIDIGQNDLTAGYFLNKSAEEFIPNAMNELSRVIKGIYENGGRNFWIHNTGPLGCLPYVFLREKLMPSQLDSVGCGIPNNKLAQIFNKILNETVVQLRKELAQASFTYVDIYSVKYLLISRAEKYGFDKPLAACCGYGGGDFNFNFAVRCGDTDYVNGSKVLLGRSCENPSKRIIWDGIHYTDAANKWIFDRIAGGKYSDPPNSLNMACHNSN